LVIRLVVLVALLGGINSNVLFASRIPLAMSRDGLMPSWLDRVNAGGTPVAAHALSIAMSLVFILTGSFNAVLALAAFFFVANYTISFSAIFALRRREPDAPRPFRAPWFPWTTGLVLVGSVAFLVGSVLSDQTNSVRSLVLLALSYPAFLLVRRLQRG
jgi:basic amino acid/polyamine antiporter, APA family